MARAPDFSAQFRGSCEVAATVHAVVTRYDYVFGTHNLPPTAARRIVSLNHWGNTAMRQFREVWADKYAPGWRKDDRLIESDVTPF